MPAFRVDMAFAGILTSWVTDTGRSCEPDGVITVRDRRAGARGSAVSVRKDLMGRRRSCRRSDERRINTPRRAPPPAPAPRHRLSSADLRVSASPSTATSSKRGRQNVRASAAIGRAQLPGARSADRASAGIVAEAAIAVNVSGSRDRIRGAPRHPARSWKEADRQPASARGVTARA
jgi:hypothetical protein